MIIFLCLKELTGFFSSVQGLCGSINDDDNPEDFDLEPLDRGPYFDISASQNVTALVGKSAILRCRVKNLSDRTVSTVSKNITIKVIE